MTADGSSCCKCHTVRLPLSILCLENAVNQVKNSANLRVKWNAIYAVLMRSNALLNAHFCCRPFLCRSFSALRNKHHVAQSKLPRCVFVGVRVVYLLKLLLVLLLESVHTRMFCANCVSAIVFNMHANTLMSRASKQTRTHTLTPH